MADNVRFHSKYHGKAHHTSTTPGYFDSGVDPIAGPGNEFQGNFHLSGCFVVYDTTTSNTSGTLCISTLNKTLSLYSTIQGNSAAWNQGSKFVHSGLSPNKLVYLSDSAAISAVSLDNAVAGIEIGIGTLSPTAKLDVVYAGGTDLGLRVKGGASRAKVVVSDNDTSAYFIAEDNYISIGGHNSLHAKNLNISEGGGTDGNVGIGTTTPSTNLEIKGAGSGADVLNIHKGTGVGGLRFTFDGTNYVSYIRTYETSTLANNYMVFGVSQGNTTAGADVMHLMGDGKVGIGTQTPTEMLTVAGSISARNDLYVGGKAFLSAGNSGEVYIGDEASDKTTFTGNVIFNDKVGIGTTTPSTKLHSTGSLTLEGGAGTADLIFTSGAGRIIGVSGNTHVMIGAGMWSVGNGSDNPTFKTHSNTYLATTTGKVGIGTTDPQYQLHVGHGEWLSGRVCLSGAQPLIAISDTDSSYPRDWMVQSYQDRLRVLEDNVEKVCITDGNVGIGTDAPADKLQVEGSIRLPVDSFLNWGGTGTRIVGNANYMRFNTGSLDALSIDSSQRVGIGTTAPDKTLTVAGDISARGDIYVSNSSIIYEDGTTFESGDSVRSKSAFTTLQSNSGRWKTNEDDITNVASTSGGWNSTKTTVDAGNSNWDSAFVKAVANEADITVIAGASADWESASYQILDPTTDLNVDSNTLVVDKSTNRVGIGTDAPGARLHVSSDIWVGGHDGPFLRTYAQTDDNLRWVFSNSSTGLFELIQAGNSWVDQGTRLAIDRSGKVGIGTTAPNEVLTVAGYVSAQDGMLLGRDTYLNFNLTKGSTGYGIRDNNGNLEFKCDMGHHWTSFSTVASGATVNPGALGHVAYYDQTGNDVSQAPALQFNSTENAVGVGTTSSNVSGIKATLHVKPKGNDWEDGILIQHDNANTGWRIVADRDYNGLRFGFDTDTSVQFNSAAATQKFCIHEDGEITVTEQINFSDQAILASSRDVIAWIDREGDNGGTAFQVVENTNKAVLFHVAQQNNAVGIGTTDPSHRLHVAGGSMCVNNNFGIYWENNAVFYRSSDVNQPFLIQPVRDLAFRNSSGTDTFTWLQDSGRIGIGTTSPGSPLEVAGGQIRGYSGAVSAPTYSFTDNPTTGISRPTTNTLNIVTDGAERVRVTATGNVGIGTTSPGNSLIVQRTGASSNTSHTDQYPIIGLSNQTASYTAGNYIGAINFSKGLSNGSGIRAGIIASYSNTGSLASNHGADLRFNTAAESAGDGSTKMTIKSDGNVGIGTAAPNYPLEVKHATPEVALEDSSSGGSFRFKLDGVAASIGNYSNGGDLQFLTRAAGGSSTTKMTISGNGMVGIGTTAPSSSLHVQSSNAMVARFTRTAAANPSLAFGVDDTDYGMLTYNHNGGSNSYVSLGDHAVNDALVVNSAGNVGIGTDAPGEKLHVAGAGTQRIRVEETGNTVKAKILASTTAGVVATESSHPLGFDTNDNRKMTILADGKVGIGTTAPDVELQVNASSGSAEIKIVGAEGGNAALYLWSDQGDDTDDKWVLDANTDHNFYIENYNGSGYDQLLTVKPDGKVGIGTTNPNAVLDVRGDLVCGSAGNVVRLKDDGGGNTMLDGMLVGSDIIFRTGGAVEKMRITDAGKVGIGHTSPDYPLEVKGTISINDGAGESNGRLFFDEQGHNYGFSLLQTGTANPTIDGIAFNPLPTNTFYIIRHDNSTEGVPAFALKRATGNVGIGTTDPQSPLHVMCNTNAYGLTLEENTGAEAFSLKLDGGGHLQFEAGVHGDLDSKVVVMTMRDDGKVGIGTTTPSNKLEVAGSGTVAKLTSSSSSVYLHLSNSGSGLFEGIGSLGNRLGFLTQNAERLSILGGTGSDAGNVGIGTTAPKSKVHVSGGPLQAGRNFYNVLNYAYTGSNTTGVLIATNYTFDSANEADMPTVIIEGYDYSGGSTIGLTISWYPYNSTFISQSVASHGSYTPRVRLLRRKSDNKVLIHLDDDINSWYYNSFTVRTYGGTFSDAHEAMQGWSWSHTDVSTSIHDRIVDVPYKNRVGYLYVNSLLGVGTTTPAHHIDVQDTSFTNNCGIRVYSKGSNSDAGIMLKNDAREWSMRCTGSDQYVIRDRSAGSNRITIKTDGNVGIGTDSAAQKLHIAGNICGNLTSNALRIQTTSGYLDAGPQNTSWCHMNTDRSRFYFSTELTVDGGKISSYNEDLELRAPYSGNAQMTLKNGTMKVGINTSAPDATLDVNGGMIVRTSGSNSNTRTLTIRDGSDSQINFGSYPGSWSPALQIQNNEVNDFVWISALDSSNNARFRTGYTGLDFYVGGTNSTGVLGLQIHESGYVGVGPATTTVSGYDLTCGSSSDTKLVLQGASNPYIRWREGSTDKFYMQWNTGGYMHFNNQEHSESMYLANNGLGIGTSSPNGKLDVRGNSYLYGWAWMNNYLQMNYTSPTIYLQDTDHRSSMIHCNSNQWYVLRGSGTNSTGWSQYNSMWPLTLNLENNDCTLGGALYVKGDITAFYSDARLKKNVTNITDALSKVGRLNGVTYNPNQIAVDVGAAEDAEEERVGLLAHEVEEVLPQAVKQASFDLPDTLNPENNVTETSKTGEHYKTVQYDKLIPLLVEAIKELKAEVEELKRDRK